jgi:hypothetical protein
MARGGRLGKHAIRVRIRKQGFPPERPFPVWAEPEWHAYPNWKAPHGERSDVHGQHGAGGLMDHAVSGRAKQGQVQGISEEKKLLSLLGGRGRGKSPLVRP